MPQTATLAPDYLLWKAGQVRGAAEAMNDSWQRKALREIAQLYEWLADEMESQERRINEQEGGGIISAHSWGIPF